MVEETRMPPEDATGSAEAERSFGALFSQLSAQAAELVRQEVALARLEVSRALGRAFAAGLWMGIGAVVALLAIPTLIAAIILGLGALIGSYLFATLIVGGLLLVTAGALAGRGTMKLRAGLAPEQTIESVRETTAWAAGEARGVRAALAGQGGTPAGEARSLRAPAPLPVAATRAVGGGGASQSEGGDRGRDRDRGERSGAGASRGKRTAKGFTKRIFEQIQEDDVPNQAAGVAFFAFLSFPPTILVLFALTGFFGGDDAAAWITERLSAMLPGEAGELVDTFVANVVHEQAPGPFSIGLLLALWAASNVFMALSRSLNTAYSIRDERPWIKQRAISLGMLLVFVLFFLGGSVVLIGGPTIAAALNLAGVAEVVWNIIQWPLAALLVALAFGAAFYVLPARDQGTHKREIFKGALAATVFWLIATVGFRLYITNFGNYTETYGIIGTIIVLLLWLWISALVVLVGGEIASELENDARAAAA
jgi:membrane protein